MGTKFIQECYWQERFFRNVLGQELHCQEPFFEELYFQERFAGYVLVGTFWQERCVRGPKLAAEQLRYKSFFWFFFWKFLRNRFAQVYTILAYVLFVRSISISSQTSGPRPHTILQADPKLNATPVRHTKWLLKKKLKFYSSKPLFLKLYFLKVMPRGPGGIVVSSTPPPVGGTDPDFANTANMLLLLSKADIKLKSAALKLESQPGDSRSVYVQ
jgi:hypothetical protein